MGKKLSKEAKILQIFNLEFPSYIEELKIGDYLFKRVENYKEAFGGMMCLVKSSGSEFDTQIKTGSHQITATVEMPRKEKKCVLPFGNKKATQLDDVLFLLTIFTDRNVFKKDWENGAVISDHRMHQYGGQLRCSVQYESRWKHIATGRLKTEEEMKGIPIFDYNQIDIGFESTLNKILDLISSKKWQDSYEGGYFLFLFRAATQRQMIETSFISCWTIWEHIFAIKNRNWLDDEGIKQISGDKKISFILNEYFLKKIDVVAKKSIKEMYRTRSRLVHFGKKTEQIDIKEMEMFIRLTEQLIARILGLSPSNIFNSFERLDSFLKGCKK
ncbi:MAG: hypothetical protein WCX23_02830 [Candidatus Paceibacterota bacterium]